MDQAALKDIVRTFLNNHRKAVFATTDDQGLPTTSLMLYVIDDELNVADLRGKAYEIPADQLEEVHAFFKSKNTSKYYVEGAEDFVMFKMSPDFIRWLDAESGELQIVNVHEVA